MKLIFEKTDDGNFNTYIEDGSEKKNFGYSDLIIKLYKEKSIEDAECIGKLTDEERNSIEKMIEDIRQIFNDDVEIQDDMSSQDLFGF